MKTFCTLFVGILFTLTMACGYGSKNYGSGTTGSGSKPAISQLSPSSMAAGSSAFTLTVNGSNFAVKAVVNWNGAAQTTNYMSTGQLTVAVPASMVASQGTAQVTVTNPAVAGPYGNTPAQTSAATPFTIN